jgi:hypothetical protein
VLQKGQRSIARRRSWWTVQRELPEIRAQREAREQDERHKPIRDAYDPWPRTAFQRFELEDNDDKLPDWPEDLP